jgi:hypothetical protein
MTLEEGKEEPRTQFTDHELKLRFTYHPPKPKQIPMYELLRSRALELARDINLLVPDGREKALALTHLEEAIQAANAGIARRST